MVLGEVCLQVFLMALIACRFTDNCGWNFFRKWTNSVNEYCFLSRKFLSKFVGLPTSDVT